MKEQNYIRLNIKNITDNKEFCKTVKPFLTNNTITTHSTLLSNTLVQNRNFFSKMKKVAKEFKSFFTTIMKNCGTEQTVKEDVVIKTLRSHSSKIYINADFENAETFDWPGTTFLISLVRSREFQWTIQKHSNGLIEGSCRFIYSNSKR